MPTTRIGLNSTDDVASCNDVMMKEEAPTTNYDGGTNPLEATKYDVGDHANSLVKFDLTSLAGVTVTSAKLGLYLYDFRETGPDTVSVFRVLRDWVESEATWNIYSTGNSWSTGGGIGDGTDRVAAAVGSLSIGTAAQYYEFDLDAADVQDCIDNASANFGWLLERTDGQDDQHGRIFRQSNGTDGQRPYLEVTYTGGGLSIPVVQHHRLRNFS